MTVTFAEKLARIPHYEPGTSLDDAKARAETADAVKLASNESPLPPHPKVVEAIAAAAGDINRYPDPQARLLRNRIADVARAAFARPCFAIGYPSRQVITDEPSPGILTRMAVVDPP